MEQTMNYQDLQLQDLRGPVRIQMHFQTFCIENVPFNLFTMQNSIKYIEIINFIFEECEEHTFNNLSTIIYIRYAEEKRSYSEK